MNIPMESLRELERERGISFDTVVDAIERALASAYLRMTNADESRDARAEIDRESGAHSKSSTHASKPGASSREAPVWSSKRKFSTVSPGSSASAGVVVQTAITAAVATPSRIDPCFELGFIAIP